jgi:uncharacterized protein YcbX
MPEIVGRIVGLRLYRLKGAQGSEERELAVSPTHGVRFDRRFAIKRDPKRPDEWVKKTFLYVGMNAPLMAAEIPVFDRYGLSQKWLANLSLRLGSEKMLSVIDTNEQYSMADTKGAFLSIINLATVRALGRSMKLHLGPNTEEQLDAGRFRANVLIEAEAFSELALVDRYPGIQEVDISGIRHRIDDVTERCNAINASRRRGAFDLEVRNHLKQLMASRGYSSTHRVGRTDVLGIYAQPLQSGTIKLGGTITLR